MKADGLFHRFFQEWPQRLLELLRRPYSDDSYRFVSGESKQTGFRVYGSLKPNTKAPVLPLIFAEVLYQRDNAFYGRFLNQILLHLYQNKPERCWLAMVLYPARDTEKQADIALLTRKRRRKFEPCPKLDQCQTTLPGTSLNTMRDMVEALQDFSGRAALAVPFTINQQDR